MTAAGSSRVTWGESSSTGANGECISWHVPHVVVIRESKDPNGPRLALTAVQWKVFSAALEGCAAYGYTEGVSFGLSSGMVDRGNWTDGLSVGVR